MYIHMEVLSEFFPIEIVERILDEKALLEWKDNIANVNEKFLQWYIVWNIGECIGWKRGWNIGISYINS